MTECKERETYISYQVILYTLFNSDVQNVYSSFFGDKLYVQSV